MDTPSLHADPDRAPDPRDTRGGSRQGQGGNDDAAIDRAIGEAARQGAGFPTSGCAQFSFRCRTSPALPVEPKSEEPNHVRSRSQATTTRTPGRTRGCRTHCWTNTTAPGRLMTVPGRARSVLQDSAETAAPTGRTPRRDAVYSNQESRAATHMENGQRQQLESVPK